MKQAKKFLHILRVAAEITAFLLIALCAFIICSDKVILMNALMSLRPLGVCVIVGYVVFSLGEDYINNRILRPRY